MRTTRWLILLLSLHRLESVHIIALASTTSKLVELSLFQAPLKSSSFAILFSPQEAGLINRCHCGGRCRFFFAKRSYCLQITCLPCCFFIFAFFPVLHMALTFFLVVASAIHSPLSSSSSLPDQQQQEKDRFLLLMLNRSKHIFLSSSSPSRIF